MGASPSPSPQVQRAIELFRARLNRQEHTPEELLERRAGHDALVAAMRDEVARVTAERSGG